MLSIIYVVVLILATSGCATVIDGSSQLVTFNSSPNGARIYANGMEVGTTPLITSLKRSKTTMILAKNNCYEDQQLSLQTKLNTYFWGNILFYGGLFSSTTDYASDAMIEYSPNMYYITLNPIPLLQSNDSGLGAERGVRTRIEQEGIGTDRRVRTFIVRNHRNLTTDISNGRGEYLASLCSLLGLPENDKTLRGLRFISSRNPEAPSFADALLSQYPVDDADTLPQGQKNNGSRR